ncbi:YraN family protein [candidate division WWE3 bacterium CG_4_10_14_0_2_um_filter_42_7]|uniref:UPF0102 protein COY33_01710 n=2 Tax=Bacteria candidate phyla TaxID=1783234 RepID=A0A2M7TD56_UNCKA|nr:MAG: YraN family protein [Candidatus Nealsonbacteria bacterium CG08_land_8_20_14_0_20_43_11]PIZ43323.1 MAG: YraN family protein [candidate division WWE3 bacterium CG_4_10_14_0_2_um_filter_42_7]
MNDKELGALGEKVAAEYLKRKGYEILEKNFTVGFSQFNKGEIDIIARKSKTIVFAEVKTMEIEANGKPVVLSPEQRVDFRKQKQLIKLAQIWLVKNKIPFDSLWQIDVISVKISCQNRKAKVSHFENAFGS